MHKINYPTDASEIDDLNNKYKTIFSDTNKSKDLAKLFKKAKFRELKQYSFEKIVSGKFDLILEIKEKYDRINNISDTEKNTLFKIFNYESKEKIVNSSFQSSISKFFIDNKRQIELNSCYFCDLEYIHAFTDFGDYINAFDFINRAHKEELMAIDQIGDSTAEFILGERKKSVLTMDTLNFKRNDATIKDNIEKFSAREKFYFTLDHVLCKSKYPIFALSLYNLVPCCHNCNSKFKSTKHLITKKSESFMSPSSSDYSVDKDMKFEIYFHTGQQNFVEIKSSADFSISLVPLNNIEEILRFERIFKLSARYKNHKNEALDIIQKSKKYTAEKIKDISVLTGLNPEDIKNDIFGKEVFEDGKNLSSMSKFRKDIARNVGLIT